MEEVGTPQEDFRFFMVRTCCEKKKRSQAEHVHVHMRTRESPSGTHLHRWMLHIFIEHISCKKLPFIVSVRCSLISRKKEQQKKKHTADYCQVCALIFL